MGAERVAFSILGLAVFTVGSAACAFGPFGTEADGAPEGQTERVVLVGDGDLVRGSDATIYLIDGADRRAFPDRATFLAYGYDDGAVVRLTDHALRALPPADPIPSVRSTVGLLFEIRGFVVYIPGISIKPGLDIGTEVDACQRALETFPPTIRRLFARSHAKRCFSYAPENSNRYTKGHTQQRLRESADRLGDQVRALRADWKGMGRSGDPEIVLVAHSLGGAVAGYWAAGADDDLASLVRTVITFDSPLGGVGDALTEAWTRVTDALAGDEDRDRERRDVRPLIGSFFGGEAGSDLRSNATQAHISHGGQRVDFVQVANTRDLIVPAGASFTPQAWRRIQVECGKSADEQMRVVSYKFPEGLQFEDIGPIEDAHACAMSLLAVAGQVEDALHERPPVWGGQVPRPAALPPPPQGFLGLGA